MTAAHHRYGANLPARAWIGYLRLLAATGVLSLAVGIGVWLLPSQEQVSPLAALQLFGLIGLGGLAYLGGLWLFGAHEFELVRSLAGRLLRAHQSG